MRSFSRLIVLVCLGAVSGCSLFGDDGTSRAVELPIVAINAPNQATAGEPFLVELVIQTPNGCYSFERIEADEESVRLTLRAVGQYQGGPDVQCFTEIGEVEASYEHIPTAVGVLTIEAEGYDGRIEAQVSVE